MDRLLILLLFAICLKFEANAQTEYSSKIFFDSSAFVGTCVIESPDLDKDFLYKKLKYWVSFTYKSGKNVIDLDDKSGDVYTLILKANYNVHVQYIKGLNEYDEENSYLVCFKVKDGKIKMEIRDWINNGYYDDGSLYYPGGEIKNIEVPNRGHTPKTWKQIRGSVETFSQGLLMQFSKELLKVEEGKDDF